VTFNQQDEWNFLVMWEFIVQLGKEKAFEQIYGPQGDWAQLFRQGKGYCGTELSRDLDTPRRYVTLDFWESRAAHEAFKAQHAAQYQAIDLKCESLTEKEQEIWKFERVGNEMKNRS
jgi:heme-degrading monooxygenase HmoA